MDILSWLFRILCIVLLSVFIACQGIKSEETQNSKSIQSLSLGTENYLINPPLHDMTVRGRWLLVSQEDNNGLITRNTNQNNYVVFGKVSLFEDFIGDNTEVEFLSDALEDLKFSTGRNFSLNMFTDGKNKLIEGWINQKKEGENYKWITKQAEKIYDLGELEIKVSVRNQRVKEKMIIEFMWNNQTSTKFLLKRSDE